jgi:REP element-mobilizing transposase RayT
VHVSFKFAARRDLRIHPARAALHQVLADLREVRPDFRVIAFSLQHDHLHTLVEADSPNAFASGIRAFAIRAGKRLNQALGRTGRLFADRHHRRVLRTQAEVRAALAYVLLNHRRHAAQGVGPLEPRGVDPFSSGAWFTGWKEAVPLPADPPVVQKPRTWLGAVGWKRKGRISLSEVPGDLGRARDDGSPSTLARPGS